MPAPHTPPQRRLQVRAYTLHESLLLLHSRGYTGLNQFNPIEPMRRPIVLVEPRYALSKGTVQYFHEARTET